MNDRSQPNHPLSDEDTARLRIAVANAARAFGRAEDGRELPSADAIMETARELDRRVFGRLGTSSGIPVARNHEVGNKAVPGFSAAPNPIRLKRAIDPPRSPALQSQPSESHAAQQIQPRAPAQIKVWPNLVLVCMAASALVAIVVVLLMSW